MNMVFEREVIRIVDGMPVIESDEWTVIRDIETGEAALETIDSSKLIVPFCAVESMSDAQRMQVRAVWISPDDDFESSMGWIEKMEILAIDFPSFRDGRGYSTAYLLRKRYGWKRELRAVGDVLRDQLNYMRRCGFDAFALRADKDIRAALKSFNHYSVQYQGGVDEPLPLFRRRDLSE